MELKEFIRIVPDFKGVQFMDITTLLKDGPAFRAAINDLADSFREKKIDLVVGPESRGFAIGAPVAYALEAGFIPIRKPGKLPADKVSIEYSLEYGTDSLEIHADAIRPGQRVLLADDLLATGGTARAVVDLVERMGGEIVGLAFLIELTYLGGRARFKGYDIVSLVSY